MQRSLLWLLGLTVHAVCAPMVLAVVYVAGALYWLVRAGAPAAGWEPALCSEAAVEASDASSLPSARAVRRRAAPRSSWRALR